VRFLTTIVEAFRPGVSLDRLRSRRFPAADADRLVDQIIEPDAVRDLDTLIESVVSGARKRPTAWNDEYRAKVGEQIASASSAPALTELLEALKRHRP